MPDTPNKRKAKASNERSPDRPPSRPARAELIWEGKYDADGKRVAPLRVALPFQTVETVNESAQDRQRNLLFGPGLREEEWRNRLVWGDKKYVLPSLLPEFAGKVNLIYIDPPFDTGADFSFTATVPDDPEGIENESVTFTKEPSIIEHKAYRDTWGRGLESYLQWFYEAAVLLHELLHENGSIYVHVEPDIGNLVRVVLDEVFGAQSRRTEICWKRTSSHGNVSKSFGEIWESIFFYTKSEDWIWNQQYVPFDDSYIESHFTGRDPDGRRWTTSDLRNPGYRPNLIYEYKGYKPHKNGWAIYERQDSGNDEPDEMTAVLGSKPPAQQLTAEDFRSRIVARGGPVVVLNDEAHHTHDEENEWNKVVRGSHPAMNGDLFVLAKAGELFD